jgi:hypothetical protein
VQLKRELGNTSPQDNFSKWAKLDRQHNKAMTEFNKIGAYFEQQRIWAKLTDCL